MALKKNIKTDKVKYNGTCTHCLETSVFRIVTSERGNEMVCTRCLATYKYVKKRPDYAKTRLILRRKLNIEEHLKRIYMRTYKFFVGDWRTKPFNFKHFKG